jgi:uncharacterized protein with HEPN domain
MSSTLLVDTLEGIYESILLIEERFANIKAADDFVLSSQGVLTLDSIAMRLQVIGELVKKIEKTDGSFYEKYPEVKWAMIARLRDIISHHYDTIDHEIIYDICKNHIPELKDTVSPILQTLSS